MQIWNPKWLYPGLEIKRWLLLLMAGVTITGVGITYLLRHFYVTQPYPVWFYYATFMFYPRPMRAIIFGLVGVLAIVVGLVQMNRSLLRPFVQPGQDLVEVLYRYHQKGRGPKIVAIGGGHGLSTLLRGLKEYTSNITAVVTVADDGGSSGRLRKELGLLPPGDFRNCIAALSEAEDLTRRLFQYRFSEGMGLDGHSFGNLFIAAMAGVTGSFEDALLEASYVLAVRGRVLPATLEEVALCAEVAEMEDGEIIGWRRVVGESQIPKSGGRILRVFLEPEVTRAYPEVLRAILDADLILAGPGSLYTSVLPNLLVREVVDALRVSGAPKVYIANVATEPGETDGYTVGDHVRVLNEHLGERVFRTVLYNTNHRRPLPDRLSWVKPGPGDWDHMEMIGADLVDENRPWRHDPYKLAAAVMDVLYGRRITPPRGEANHGLRDGLSVD